MFSILFSIKICAQSTYKHQVAIDPGSLIKLFDNNQDDCDWYDTFYTTVSRRGVYYSGTFELLEGVFMQNLNLKNIIDYP